MMKTKTKMKMKTGKPFLQGRSHDRSDGTDVNHIAVKEKKGKKEPKE